MPKKKTARKKRTVLGAEDLKPGVRFKYGGFYGRPSVGVEILRSRESATGDFGLPRDRWWSRNLDTGEEGYVSLGPEGKLNVDAVLGAESAPPRHHATKKKSPAQLQREIDEVLARPLVQSPYSVHSPEWERERQLRKLTREKARLESPRTKRSHATKTGVAKTAMTAEQFNALAERSAETLLVPDFEALLAAVRKLQPRTIIGVQGEYGGKKKIAEGRFIRLAETGPIAASWSRRAIVEEIVPGWRLEGAPRQLDVSPEQLRALPKTKFKHR